jgi:hypothetical protein
VFFFGGELSLIAVRLRLKERTMIWLVVLSLVAISSPSSDHGEIHGFVRDENGAVIVPTRIEISWNTGPGRTFDDLHHESLVLHQEMCKDDAPLRCFLQGTLGYKATLSPGFYDVCVHAASFMPLCKVVRILPRKSIEFFPVLQTDPAIMDEYRKRFEHPERN